MVQRYVSRKYGKPQPRLGPTQERGVCSIIGPSRASVNANALPSVSRRSSQGSYRGASFVFGHPASASVVPRRRPARACCRLRPRHLTRHDAVGRQQGASKPVVMRRNNAPTNRNNAPTNRLGIRSIMFAVEWNPAHVNSPALQLGVGGLRRDVPRPIIPWTRLLR